MFKINKVLTAPTTQDQSERQYELQEVLGEGGEATIYKAITKINNQTQEFALKIHKKTIQLKDNYKNFLKILKQDPQTSIIKIHDFFDNEEGFILVMELGKQNLQDFLKEKKVLNLDEKTNICQQVIQSIKILHDKNYIHRDIKPENFIITYDQNVKLIDFGIIRYQDDPQKTNQIGTAQYMAPELQYNSYSNKADIWSLGCLLYEIYTGEMLFECQSQKKLNDQLEIFKINPNNAFEKLNRIQLNKQIQDLIKSMLFWLSHNRPNINEVLNHFIRSKYDDSFFKTLLQFYKKNQFHKLQCDLEIYSEIYDAQKDIHQSEAFQQPQQTKNQTFPIITNQRFSNCSQPQHTNQNLNDCGPKKFVKTSAWDQFGESNRNFNPSMNGLNFHNQHSFPKFNFIQNNQSNNIPQNYNSFNPINNNFQQQQNFPQSQFYQNSFSRQSNFAKNKSNFSFQNNRDSKKEQ